MKMREMFGSAKWISSPEENKKESFVIRRIFDTAKGAFAKIRLIGLGTFSLYVNGERVGEELFLPMNSEYENMGMPKDEMLRYRIYATEYDISKYLSEGENILAVHLGAGWYTGIWDEEQKRYGEKKLIYKMTVSDSLGEREIVSDGTEECKESFVYYVDVQKGEKHDYRDADEKTLFADSSAEGWERVRFSRPVESEYMFTDCPADKVLERITPTVVYKCEEYTLYDAGKNISGYPVLTSISDGCSEISVIVSEALSEDKKDISEEKNHGQILEYITDTSGISLYPRFTWVAFRYFKVIGNADVSEVDFVAADAPVSSSFNSDSEVLNWLYNAFILTQKDNMHRGIPSDCPHLERLGYTGDGQLACRAALYSLDAYEFYKKWIGDISDCQDSLTGHVQYCAPYIFCGGGPGGWGSAIVSVPYDFYKYYGDESVIRENYSGMLLYLDYLEARCEYGLVSSSEPNNWCLGDWCTPPVQSNIPAKFVNTYFYAKSAERVIEIAKILGKEEDIPRITERMNSAREAIVRFYYNDHRSDSTFLGNVKGAGAFALDIGLGNEMTAKKLGEFYTRNPYFDTGIFGTEVVTRMLFKLGYADTAFALLTQDKPHGFGKWMRDGETTLLEYWPGRRSNNHPMFGAAVASVFEYIVGIRQEEGSAGFKKILISPVKIKDLSRVSGSVTTPVGKICVSYVRDESFVYTYTVDIPSGACAKFVLDGYERELHEGKNVFSL